MTPQLKYHRFKTNTTAKEGYSKLRGPVSDSYIHGVSSHFFMGMLTSTKILTRAATYSVCPHGYEKGNNRIEFDASKSSNTQKRPSIR